MSSTPEFNESQLQEARAAAWHQQGEPLLTLEAAREWVTRFGLVPFAPRGQQLPAPAGSLVEATLGKAEPEPALGASEVARSLVARMVGEGTALPLNLMGVGGDVPDFVCSAQVFSYIFTLRGDKGWKQPPSTSEGMKVSPLGLRVFEVLTEKGGLTAAELANELGRELTEAAVIRALDELWSQLRVIPLPDQGRGPTLWELTTRRFTKAIKAGANAGQPTALSALVSLYLQQAVAATEEEIETFLSPLSARSRTHEVVNALSQARQLEPVVLEGKRLLFLPGSLPEFAVSEVAPAVDGEAAAAEGEGASTEAAGGARIRSFASPAKERGAFRGKPASGFGAGRERRAGGAERPRTGARREGGFVRKDDRERRPFRRDAAAKPDFTKPWDEDRKPRAAETEATDAFSKFRRPEKEDRPPLGKREQAGLPPEKRTYPPKREDDRGGFAKKSFAKRPYTPRSEGEGTAPRRPYKPREGAGGRGGFDRASKPGSFAKRPYTPRGESEGGAERRPYKPREGGGGRGGFDRASKPGGFAKGPYTPRSEGEGGAERRPYKPREGAGGRGGFDRASKPGGFAKRPYTPRSEGEGGAERRPYKPREGAGGRGGFDRASKPGGFAKRPYTPRSEGEGTVPRRPYKPREGAGGRGGFDRASKPGGFAKRPYTPRGEGEGGAERRPYKPREGAGGRGGFDRASKPGGFAKRPYTPRSEGEGGAERRPFKPRPAGAGGAKFGGRPAGKFGSKPGGKFGGKPGAKFGSGSKFGGKPGGSKFGGAKKFGKPAFGAKRTSGPRKPKPGAEE